MVKSGEGICLTLSYIVNRPLDLSRNSLNVRFAGHPAKYVCVFVFPRMSQLKRINATAFLNVFMQIDKLLKDPQGKVKVLKFPGSVL